MCSWTAFVRAASIRSRISNRDSPASDTDRTPHNFLVHGENVVAQEGKKKNSWFGGSAIAD